MEKINLAVENAAHRKIEALQALDEIPGIGLAVATAILTVCYPDEFTIIDTRVLGQLDLLPKRLSDKRRNKGSIIYNTGDWTAREYVYEYLPKVKECSQRKGYTFRECDQALWGSR